ncbi:hypothetical protein NL676_000594 [Syzygium grande]|nr:hypothetical protein NL676_000594 [Syzygium grande]
MFAQQNDSDRAIAGISYSKMLLTIALPAMSTAFLTGVTMTVDKLPWLANTIFYLGLVFLFIISVAKLLQYPPWFWSHHRSIHRLICWLVLGFNYLWGVKPYLLYDPKKTGRLAGPPLVGLRMVLVNPRQVTW